jgi:hypothetical protein
MNSYPLPGETLVRTLRNQSFGEFGGYDADEPAPPEVARAFRSYLIRMKLVDMTHATWKRRKDLPSFEAWNACVTVYSQRINDLLRLMGGHLYKSYVCDGHRIRLRIEPDVCRKKSLWIEVMR